MFSKRRSKRDKIKSHVERFVAWANQTGVEPIAFAGYWVRRGDGYVRVDVDEQEQDRLLALDDWGGARIGAAIRVTRDGADNPGQWGAIHPTIVVLPEEAWVG